jgi:hypothetical protein
MMTQAAQGALRRGESIFLSVGGDHGTVETTMP